MDHRQAAGVAGRIPVALDTMLGHLLNNEMGDFTMRSRVAPICAALFAAFFTIGMPDMVNAEDTAEAAAKKVLRHVVMFQFTEETTEQQVREIEKAFAALPDKIDAIVDFEWGTDVSVEGRAQGFTHCFLVTFASQEGLAEYLPHAGHQDFVKLLKPQLAKVLVLDYWARR